MYINVHNTNLSYNDKFTSVGVLTFGCIIHSHFEFSTWVHIIYKDCLCTYMLRVEFCFAWFVVVLLQHDHSNSLGVMVYSDQ